MNTQVSLRIRLILPILLVSSYLAGDTVPVNTETQLPINTSISHAEKTTPILTIDAPKKSSLVSHAKPKHRLRREQRIAKNLTNQTKTISKMNFDELKAAKTVLLSKNDKQTAIKYVERMLKMCEDISIISDLTIELADLYFDIGELAPAEILFTEFARLYPGSNAIEYASYKAILCSFYATLSAERDQSKTHHTIALTDSFIERKDIFNTYANEVLNIRTSCYKKAVESEVNIFNFYVNRGKIVSAQNRLKNVRKDWLSKFPEIETQLTHMEIQLEDKIMLLAGIKKPIRTDSSVPIKTLLPHDAPTVIAQAEQPKPFSARF